MAKGRLLIGNMLRITIVEELIGIKEAKHAMKERIRKRKGMT